MCGSEAVEAPAPTPLGRHPKGSTRLTAIICLPTAVTALSLIYVGKGDRAAQGRPSFWSDSMNVLVYVLLALASYAIAYRFYGRFIARSMGEEADRATPAVAFNDGKDFVPTRPSVVFAHHYSTIAGAGPIVGPTLGILYGVGPAWLWVVLGAIFFGAVHDFGALFSSIRERGSSMAEIARKSLGQTGFIMFISFTILLIILVTSAFLSLTAVSLTSLYPLEKLGLDSTQTLLRTAVVNGQQVGIIGGIASSSVIFITLIAPFLGYLVTKRKIQTSLAYVMALGICTVSIWVGFVLPLALSPGSLDGDNSRLHPIRLRGAGLVHVAAARLCQRPDTVFRYGGDDHRRNRSRRRLQGVTVKAPVTNFAVGAAKIGPVWPFLFITIACGAISGFHALVAGGTSSKQLARESRRVAIGFGGMLLEGLLAVLVLVAIGSGLNLRNTWRIVWPTTGAGNPILAFALSMGHLLHGSLGISVAIGTVLGILIVEGFLITTLDSAVRLNRYLFEELWRALFEPPRVHAQNSGLIPGCRSC